MKTNAQLMAATIMALGMAAVSTSLMAADDETKPEMEKCGGIVKAGMNDCAGNGHACAGQGKADSDPNEWVKLPKGTCEKLTGGAVIEAKDMKMK
ncbi:MAG: DUF2282 domain-containing protein [Candidatus Thiothrix singaporensis]|uniref:DUF2282 domain-containing protein n=1 Tax=Candidatus Thiothrix singaporensis TaxID=2799669 RepID=A0A7L6AYK2_9GAMM|nr:MAG: DUF2282 domain-containing protein [Candidatus Thiothrix singaporensis]